MRAYKHMLNLVKGQMFWPKNNEGPILPYLAKRMSGKPIKKKRRESLEGKKGTKLSRIGRVMRYGYCHEKDHNKVGCPRRSEYVKVIPFT